MGTETTTDTGTGIDTGIAGATRNAAAAEESSPPEWAGFRQSNKLSEVCYEIRGPVIEHADALEEAGHSVLRLNTGNPALFGFEAPEEVLQDIIRMLPQAHGYTESRGILPARRAVAQHYQERGLDTGVEDVFLGNGVSELVSMSVQALVEDGDEVLIPAPDFPLWTAVTTMAGGKAVHYVCDESADWYPDLDDMAAKITDRTRAVVIINPNNPTGAVYPPEILQGILDLARRHNLMVFADEVYDKILYDDAVHHTAATLAPDLVVLTFSGLSKAYRVAGFRSGWLVVSGPRHKAKNYLEGLTMLASMRLCPNAPAQHAIQAALGGRQSIKDLVLPGGRLREQRDRAWEKLNEIPGVSCVKPKGALYAFPRLDPKVHRIHDDEKFVLDLLLREKIQVVQGTGFNWAAPDHFRILTLPYADDLEAAISRIGRFLEGYRQ
ncbi:pyridoxal phosphate-dependent aminotransferase [Streptomyces sp. HNM0574]|uniref:pyridoxal phosphate-dependent aminotransferase n=1 Tax=Streptomyces sp. HNM0574 TaxID=2714954 RepID=UPI00146DC9FA|nr:pyridoxal phosphate-dependent aminotransferase [Streptomyces sp. HNM0574]NLU66738.1 pyridoxal phosphate-dependent aminotransferase [Streptomyces sp. HNM0574]